MPEIKNTFLKAKMNKDLDDRLIPNGEYRDALNLQISRSESSDVGEFETMLGNTSLAYLKLGSVWENNIVQSYAGKVIGQYTDEANANIYTFSTAYTGSGVTPRDIQVITPIAAPTYAGVNTFDWILTDGTNVLDPTVLGIEVGMLCWGPAVDESLNGANFDPYVTAVTSGYIRVSWTRTVGPAFPLPLPAHSRPFTIGWCNKIHVFNTRTQILTLLVEGGFLNFTTLNRIYGVNLIEDLLFWTDNRNQPRKINITLANPDNIAHPTYYTSDDSIAVAKYYPYETPKVLEQVTQSTATGWFITDQPAYNPTLPEARGYVLTMADVVDTNIKIGDIVTGFEARNWPGSNPQQEIWTVTTIGPFTSLNPGSGLTLLDTQLVVYSQLYQFPFNTPVFPVTTYVRKLTFSRPTQTNQGDPTNENYLPAEIGAAPVIPAATLYLAGERVFVFFERQGIVNLPIPQVGDLVTSADILGWNEYDGAPSTLDKGITTPGIETNVRIASISNIPTIPCGGTGCKMGVTLTKDIQLALGSGDPINIGNNPNYLTDWGGDPDLLEEIFLRFSYRFKFIDNEYSLMAPFSQICFIPEQKGLFGGGQNPQITDMDETFKSTMVRWFENKIDSVGLKIPMPLLKGTGKTEQETLDYLTDNYKVKAIDILYKESDGRAVKVIETVETTLITAGDLSLIPGPFNALDENIKYYYTYNYKSIKPFKTLPETQTTRVYDKVPVKALGQEVISNRVTYANFVEAYTPPPNINYEVTPDNKAVINLGDEVYDNYTQYPNSTLKQNRNYQVGWVLGDKYGRQSSVILSVNDDRDDVNGSSFYAPYKSYGDVSALNTYEWLGDVMRMKINSGISPTVADNNTGEPGTHKDYLDTAVDSISLINGGTGYAVGALVTTSYDNGLTGEGPGLGSGLEVEITSVTAAVIDGIRIINPGTGYADGQLLRVDGGGTDAIIQVTVNPPNVLGWYSYKFVVKQQEQDYYNVYFPGFTRGWPNTSIVNTNYTLPAAGLGHGNEAGETSFAILVSDNINKVPRNLNTEVYAPNDHLFNSDVILYGRVNNPDNYAEAGAAPYPIWDSAGEPWNCQYYPGRIADEVNQIGLVGMHGFEIANSPFSSVASFGDFSNQNQSPGPPILTPRLPYGGTGGTACGGVNQAFYNVEANPLVAQIIVGSTTNQPNLNQDTSPTAIGVYTLGALVTNEATGPGLANTINSMRPFLSISETVPTETNLPLFWETGDTGDIDSLNRSLNASYDGVVGCELGVEYFDEATTATTSITPVFGFLDSAGTQITTGITVNSITITDGNGVDATSRFDLTPVTAYTWTIDTAVGSCFWWGTDSAIQGEYTIVFHTEYTTGLVTYFDTITGSKLILTNIGPTITTPAFVVPDPNCGGTWPSPGSYEDSQIEFYTYTALNGANVCSGNDTAELYWTITNVSFTPLNGTDLDYAEFGWEGVGSGPSGGDPTTGVLVLKSGYLNLGEYEVSVTVRDATDVNGVVGTGSLVSTVCDITFVVGYAHAPKAICAGRRPGAASQVTCLESIQYYFGSEAYTSSAHAGTLGVFPPSGIAATNFYNIMDENYMPGVCTIPPWPANYTTAGLLEGGLKLTITFEKDDTTPDLVNYNTNYTILVKPTGSLTWEAAVPIGSGPYVSPTSPGTAIDTALGVNRVLDGMIAESLTQVYHFDTLGEYSVICTPISGDGCGGGTLTDVDFYADWSDLYYPDTGGLYNPCTDCTGRD